MNYHQYLTAIDAVLRARRGGPVKLAYGVPFDSWLSVGLSPAEAAQRCLAWMVKPAKPTRAMACHSPAPELRVRALRSDAGIKRGRR